MMTIKAYDVIMTVDNGIPTLMPDGRMLRPEMIRAYMGGHDIDKGANGEPTPDGWAEIAHRLDCDIAVPTAYDRAWDTARRAYKDLEDARGTLEDALDAPRLVALPGNSPFKRALWYVEDARPALAEIAERMTFAVSEDCDKFAAVVSRYGDELEGLKDTLSNLRDYAEYQVRDTAEHTWSDDYDRLYRADARLNTTFNHPQRDIDKLTPQFAATLRELHSDMASAGDAVRQIIKALSDHLVTIDVAIAAQLQIGHVRFLALLCEKAFFDVAKIERAREAASESEE